mgnify:CR=1 FL=1
MIDLSNATWRKSAKSASNGGCVEVANLDTHVAVRDSKHPTGPALVFDGGAWDTFVAGIQSGDLTHR